MPQHEGAFEILAPTPERFLEILETREAGRVSGEAETAPRRAVFVSVRVVSRTTEVAVPVVERTVRAAFAYGPDLVRYVLHVRKDYEWPDPITEREKIIHQHEEAFADVKGQFAEGIRSRGLSVGIVEATLTLPHSSEPRPTA